MLNDLGRHLCTISLSSLLSHSGMLDGIYYIITDTKPANIEQYSASANRPACERFITARSQRSCVCEALGASNFCPCDAIRYNCKDIPEGMPKQYIQRCFNTTEWAA